MEEPPMARRHNFQTFSWFYDLHKRDLLDLDPPYQRRSVWSQSFKDYFVDTVLLQYPSPAIFLYEDISDTGRSQYHVVDGKQRLTTMFEFVADEFPVGEDSGITALQGQYFSKLTAEVKKNVWGYQFLVEYIPTDEEEIINGIFDRINRNVAKLSPQELRHAKFAGNFISTAESLSDWMVETLPPHFPRIAAQSRRQMKDVELVALLLLLLEGGPQGYSQAELDQAFGSRDDDWERRNEIEDRFRRTIELIRAITVVEPDGPALVPSRLRNQADFYSLFGAIASLDQQGQLPEPYEVAARLRGFVERVESEDERNADADLKTYYEAARSASSDKGPRETRIDYIARMLGRQEHP
jgi:hypothetical protein